MAYDPQDDGFHEIQLSGKQLVFLFMATTVVSIVIFLCGVLVGRGVPGDAEARGMASDGQPQAAGDEAGSTGGAAGGQGSVAADTSIPSPAETQPTSEADLTYPDRLADAQPPTEELEPRSEAKPAQPADPASADDVTSEPTEAPPPADTPEKPESTPSEETPSEETPSPSTPATLADAAAAKSEKPPAEGEAESSPAEAVSGNWTVQVAALRKRDEAEAVAKQLQSKGYVAFLVGPSGAGNAMYRVRVGNYKDRAEAERVMRRLAQEERLKPWITR